MKIGKWPFCHRVTRRIAGSTCALIDSNTLVVTKLRLKTVASPNRWSVSVSSTPSRNEAAADGFSRAKARPSVSSWTLAAS